MAVSAAAAYWAAGAIAAASAAASVYSGNKQAKAQNRAARQAEQQANEEATRQRQQQRRQEGQSADIGSILDQNSNSGLSGGSTLLTGAGGVKDNQMSLGGGGSLLG